MRAALSSSTKSSARFSENASDPESLHGTLAETEVKFSSGAACCVVLASEGYPEKYENGFEIVIPEEISDSVYVAGAKLEDGKLLTNGGRVLGVTAVAFNLKNAIKKGVKKNDE